uniref:Glycolipid transfer protein domain-containing protein n=1 Tax=Aegilops tauschii subsp. strangulata TaxID=200361 RepID=A0A453C0U9_AEGTS
MDFLACLCAYIFGRLLFRPCGRGPCLILRRLHGLADKIGPTMAVLRLDVQRNIERLQELYLQDPSKYSTLTAMVEKEADDGTVRKADSCARAILWLTRSMDFTVALLQRLEKEEEEEEEEEGSDQQSLAQLVEDAYKVSLKPWHGWISSAACKVRG